MMPGEVLTRAAGREELELTGVRGHELAQAAGGAIRSQN